MAVKREKIHFESVEELLGAPTIKDGTEEIKVKQIYAFENHPFKVIDDDKMEELVESIKENGVLSPVLVRPDDEGGYEMISGHRRLHAARLAGLETIPAIIKPMTDDEATIAMVDANVQREEILPSERAWSLKMKMDAMRRQGSRSDTSDHNGRKLDEDRVAGRRLETTAIVGREAGMGQTQVKRYIRLTELVPEMMDLVDQRKVGLVMAYDISFFDSEVQTWLAEYIKENKYIKQDQIEALKECPNLQNVTQYTLIQLLNGALPEKKAVSKVSLSEKKLNKYFPPHTSAKEREQVIIELLEKWHQEKEENKGWN